MKDYASISTPDHIELNFELAGPGSRAMAIILDTLFLAVLSIALVLGFIASGASFLDLGTAPWMFALLIAGIFLIQTGYFILFEAWMQGQTPGKRICGLRVVRDNGLPIGWRESLIRNLLRTVDVMPPTSYMVGGIAVMLNDHGKRLGDMAAGTMVVAERRQLTQSSESEQQWGANWVARLERGDSRHAVTLTTGQVDIRQLALMDQFYKRAPTMPMEKRQALAWRLAAPHMAHFDLDPERMEQELSPLNSCETVISKILEMARGEAGEQTQAKPENKPESAGAAKSRQWQEFTQKVDHLLRRGKSGLKSLNPKELLTLIHDYRKIIADLGRSRAMGADRKTLNHLNRLACGGHNVLYGQHQGVSHGQTAPGWPGFARQVRAHLWAVLLAGAFFFVPATICYISLQVYPELGFELVSGGFLDFESASAENMHDIPAEMRPVAGSAITTNNIRVSLLAFALGLTFGIGTALVLIYNGVHLGAVAGWLTVQGQSRALWGWIMPHGGTELLAIVLAGAAGFVLARALIAPGRLRRVIALQQVAIKALAMEVGVMGMLLVAGFIEGFISPSSINYPTRILVLLSSLVVWFAYLALADRGRDKELLA